MPTLEISETADRDLNEIYVYSYREFGEATADRYFLSLEKCFEQLAEHPGMGRDIGCVRRPRQRRTIAIEDYAT